MYLKKTFIIFIIIISIIEPLCFADDFLSENELDNYIEVSASADNLSSEPDTNSKHIIALDRKSLCVLYEKDAYSETAMASTTKIMSALIILEHCALNETIEFSKEAANVRGSTLEVTTGTKMTVNDALYGLMLRSGNDCAVALAEHLSGSTTEFAKLMNNKAQELNLKHTNFVTPHGLDDESHYTTAYDLAILTDYALKNDTFKKIVNTKTATITVNDTQRTISNTNELLGNLPGVYGVKTGFTFNAGRCLVSSCNRDGMDIIVVVLGADTKNQRTKDSIKVINYVYNTFEYVNIEKYINTNFEEYKKYYKNNVSLYKTISSPEINLLKRDSYIFPLKKSNPETLSTKFYSLNTLSSSNEKNSKIGCLSVFYEDKILCSQDIILENTLIKNNWYFYFGKILKDFNFAFSY